MIEPDEKTQEKQNETIACLFIEWVLLLEILLVIMLLICGGCASITYTDAAGNELKIDRFLWTTKIGRIEATNGSARLSVENYDSESQAMQLARDAVKLAASKAVP